MVSLMRKVCSLQSYHMMRYMTRLKAAQISSILVNNDMVRKQMFLFRNSILDLMKEEGA